MARKTRGTASLEASQFAELASAVVRQLPRDLTADKAQQWIQNQAKLQSALRTALFAPDTPVAQGSPITVDYTQSVEEMIKAGQYDWSNPDITSDHFSHDRDRGTEEIEVTLVHFDRVLSTHEAERELDKMGLRPATHPELLSFGTNYPDKQREFPIVALGSVWQGRRGHRRVPCLDRLDSDRYLDLDFSDYDWYEDCRFLAVCK